MLPKTILTAALIVVSSTLAVPAAASPVLDFTGGGVATPASSQTLGWEFSINSAQTIGGLGIWDEGGNGLGAPHLVALWASAGGAPLAQVTVSNASTPFASTQPGGRWLFESLVGPLLLAPGNYILGADYPSGNSDVVRTTASTLSLAPGFTFVQGRFTGTVTAGFDFPDATFPTSGGHFGPNLSLADTSAVPEPATLTLLGVGLSGVVARRLRRRS